MVSDWRMAAAAANQMPGLKIFVISTLKYRSNPRLWWYLKVIFYVYVSKTPISLWNIIIKSMGIEPICSGCIFEQSNTIKTWHLTHGSI